MGSVSVSSCRCCMFVSCVHPVTVLNAAFCMTCSLLMLVEDAIGSLPYGRFLHPRPALTNCKSCRIQHCELPQDAYKTQTYAYINLYNYRGISLSHSIGKLYDYVLMDLNIDYSKTDDMQCGFKNNKLFYVLPFILRLLIII